MNRSDAAFLSLLRKALFGTPLPEGTLNLDIEEWFGLYNVAARQGLHTIIWDAFPEGAVPEILAPKWKQTVQKVEKGNALMDAVVAAQKKAWEAKGIQAVLMKGQSLAALYPVPNHRLCGDVDWYFPTAKDWDAALALATKVSGAKPESDSDGDVHYTWQGVVIEHHRSFHHLSRAKACKYMALIEGEDPALLNLISINTHIMKHAMVMGISFRQVADLAMAYKACAGKIDGEAYRRHLEELGMLKWSALLHGTMVEVLGMPEEYLPYPIEKQVNTEELVGLIMRSRNLGATAQPVGGIKKLTLMLSNYAMAAKVFVPIAPGEFFARGESLAKGRLAR